MKDTISDVNNINYDIICKKKEDILNDISFESEEELLICDSIITNLEKNAADAIRHNKIVNIPSIGCIRINPVKSILIKEHENLHLARKRLNKEEYKEFVKDIVNDLKNKQKEEDKNKLNLKRIKSTFKKKYEELCKTLGKSYGDMFIYSISLLKEVPFDAEWEEYYKTLKD